MQHDIGVCSVAPGRAPAGAGAVSGQEMLLPQILTGATCCRGIAAGSNLAWVLMPFGMGSLATVITQYCRSNGGSNAEANCGLTADNTYACRGPGARESECKRDHEHT